MSAILESNLHLNVSKKISKGFIAAIEKMHNREKQVKDNEPFGLSVLSWHYSFLEYTGTNVAGNISKEFSKKSGSISEQNIYISSISTIYKASDEDNPDELEKMFSSFAPLNLLGAAMKLLNVKFSIFRMNLTSKVGN